MTRWMPRPGLTLVLALSWCALAGSLSPNSLAFGVLMGILIPLLVRPFWPDSLVVRSPLKAAAYVLLVLRDICVANVDVAKIVLLKPLSDMKPAWITVPLRLTNPEAICVLSGTITMTPGTVTADLSADGRALLVHCLHAPDPDAIRDDIIARYEARLLEFME